MTGPRNVAFVRHVAQLAVALIGVLLLAASAARAGEWAQVGCTQPNGQPAPIEGWNPEAVSGPGNYSSAYSTCAQAGGALVAESSNQWPQSRYSGYLWHYAAPDGSTIAGGTLSLNLYSPEGQAYIATPANSYPSDVVMNCQFNLPCSENGLDGGPFAGTVPIDHPGGTNIYAEAECLGPGQPGTSTESCPVGAGGDGVDAQTAIYAADIELVNESTPTASGFSGPLLQGATSGTADLTFSAQDPGGPGVYQIIAKLDSTTVYDGTPETNGGRCASIGADANGVSEFLYAQPCKQNVAVDVPVNTTRFANGQHELKITVRDAAGNASVVYDGTITTSGPPLIGVNGGLRGPHIANGEPCAGEELNLQVNRKAKPPEIPYGKPVTVRGVLHCGTVPIRNARIVIAALGSPRSAAINSSVQSALDGSFSYKVPTGPDRTLEFSYTAYSDDPAPSATSTAAIMIRPRIKLRIGLHRTSNGHTIHWTGTIGGGPYPQEGVTLDVEVQEGRRWRIFDQVVANAKGRFRYSYRFHATTQSTTYAFRVALPHTGAQGYPYAPGASNAVRVHVTP